jgi:hypothetical protein
VAPVSSPWLVGASALPYMLGAQLVDTDVELLDDEEELLLGVLDALDVGPFRVDVQDVELSEDMIELEQLTS